MNLSSIEGYPHIFHEIFGLSVHWHQHRKPQLLLCCSSLTLNHTVHVKLGLSSPVNDVILRHGFTPMNAKHDYAQPLPHWNIFVLAMEIKEYFSIWNHQKCLSHLFLIHLNPYVVLWVYGRIFLILTMRGSTLGVRIWRLQTSNSDDWSRFPRCKG